MVRVDFSQMIDEGGFSRGGCGFRDDDGWEDEGGLLKGVLLILIRNM